MVKISQEMREQLQRLQTVDAEIFAKQTDRDTIIKNIYNEVIKLHQQWHIRVALDCLIGFVRHACDNSMLSAIADSNNKRNYTKRWTRYLRDLHQLFFKAQPSSTTDMDKPFIEAVTAKMYAEDGTGIVEIELKERQKQIQAAAGVSSNSAAASTADMLENPVASASAGVSSNSAAASTADMLENPVASGVSSNSAATSTADMLAKNVEQHGT